MTHAELMAIPEWPTQFGQRTIERDGQKFVVPVAPTPMVMFDPTLYIDANGHEWAVGTIKGVRYRQLKQANNRVAFQENDW